MLPITSSPQKIGGSEPVPPSPNGSAAFSNSLTTPGVPNISSMDGSIDEINYTAEEEVQWEDDDSSDGEDDTSIQYSDVGTGAPVKKSHKRRIVGSTIGAIKKVGNAGAKVAKAGAKGSVKAGVAVTKAGVGVTKGGAVMGKKVVVSSVKASVKVGKGTVSAGVSAGKAIIASRSKNPPAREPKAKHQSTRLQMERDLHVAVNKTV